MLYPIITIVLICLATISTSQWIEGIGPNSPTLYRADYGSCVGFYNQSIYLLGGYDNKLQLTEYLIPNNTFIDHGVSYFSPFIIWGYPQYWTQVDNILYFSIHGPERLSIFDMEANSFTSSYISIYAQTGIVDKCITSSSTHLFLLGGTSSGASVSNVELYNLSNNKWQSDTPSMQTAREVFSCIFHAGTNKLYAIGGLQIPSSSFYEDSIERIEINDITQNVNAWTYIEPLSQKLSDTRCVTYKNMIYIIGGYNNDGATDKVHVINVLSDTVTLFADSLSMGLSDVAPIIVDHILYVFSGYIDSGETGINTWMTYDLYQSTAAPSSVPTTHISTADPTTSSAPTAQPTDSTSVPTTDPITSDPTQTYAATSFVPTNRPSLSPIKPASNPSLYAVLHPPSTKSTMFSYYSSTVFEGTDPEDRNNSFSKEAKHVDVITIVLSIIILSASIAIVKYLYSVLKLRKEALRNRNHMKAQPNAPQHIVAKAQEVKTHERKHTISSSSMSNSEQLYDNNLRIEVQTAGQTVEKEIECNTIETVGGGFEGRNSDQVEPEKAPKDMDENANITAVSNTIDGSSDFKHVINAQNVMKGSAVRTKRQK